ncbi:MAG TPA: hypothetical protein VLV83_09035 [Acidobacteriota bacterium]|nr:hypothetical protein [Acidobacteriota bacterium]
MKTFQDRLGISQPIRVKLVDHNPKLASSEPSGDGYLISVDIGFLSTLDEGERRAMLAHEMGHIWIFTHHPFLQTEDLANRVAGRLVSEKGLQAVYEKVSSHAKPVSTK